MRPIMSNTGSWPGTQRKPEANSAWSLVVHNVLILAVTGVDVREPASWITRSYPAAGTRANMRCAAGLSERVTAISASGYMD